MYVDREFKEYVDGIQADMQKQGDEKVTRVTITHFLACNKPVIKIEMNGHKKRRSGLGDFLKY